MVILGGLSWWAVVRHVENEWASWRDELEEFEATLPELEPTLPPIEGEPEPGGVLDDWFAAAQLLDERLEGQLGDATMAPSETGSEEQVLTLDAALALQRTSLRLQAHPTLIAHLMGITKEQRLWTEALSMGLLSRYDEAERQTLIEHLRGASTDGPRLPDAVKRELLFVGRAYADGSSTQAHAFDGFWDRVSEGRNPAASARLEFADEFRRARRVLEELEPVFAKGLAAFAEVEERLQREADDGGATESARLSAHWLATYQAGLELYLTRQLLAAALEIDAGLEPAIPDEHLRANLGKRVTDEIIELWMKGRPDSTVVLTRKPNGK